jgi:hypothetical protein
MDAVRSGRAHCVLCPSHLSREEIADSSDATTGEADAAEES